MINLHHNEYKKVKKSKHKKKQKKQKQGLIKTLKCSGKQEALVKSCKIH